MWITTHGDVTAAVERLQRRPAAELAAFIVSLAQDAGPVGEQVRTFIVGDDLGETAAALGERIRSLRIPSEYAHRYALGREIGTHLEFILDSIETLVLPVGSVKAFELLVAFFQADSPVFMPPPSPRWSVPRAG
jgi:hypothetical protein